MRLIQFAALPLALAVVGAEVVSAHEVNSQRNPAPTTVQSPAGDRAADGVPTKEMTLGTVRVPRVVEANGERLAAGTYQVRLAGNSLDPVVGETPNLEQWVEFLQNGQVKGKSVASIVPPDEIQEVAESRIPARGSSRVDLLKEDGYLRIWINRGGFNYLIYLPTQR